MRSTWSENLPQKEGFYWLYGWPFGYNDAIDPEIALVEVQKISNGFAYVTKGNFIFKSRIVGLWKKANIPELPEKELWDLVNK